MDIFLAMVEQFLDGMASLFKWMVGIIICLVIVVISMLIVGNYETDEQVIERVQREKDRQAVVEKLTAEERSLLGVE